MNRDQRLEAMASASDKLLVGLADRALESLDVEVVRGPTVGLVMARAEEPSEKLVFNFVEVAVTEAEVLAGEERGYAMVMGRSPEKALAAAVLDAAVESRHAMAEEIEAALELVQSGMKSEMKAQWAAVAPTQITFEDAT